MAGATKELGKPVHDLERIVPVFDPRVQFADDSAKMAAQVVWSSKSIELALEAIDRGLPLKANPFFDNNPALRKANLLFQYTEDELKELIRCKMDILHFADNYCFLKTPKGFQKIKLRRYQRRMLKTMQENRFVIGCTGRQIGKTTTTSIFLAWYTLFHFDKTIAMLGQKAKTGYEVLGKVKQVLAALPFFLKPGIHVWNAGSYSFDNGCRAITAATTIDAIQGFTIDALYIDEFAYLKRSIENPFWENIYPTIESNPEGKIIITSTPNGKNLFHTLWTNSLKKLNRFANFRVDWHEVPGRDDKWMADTIANIGEAAFMQQYMLSFDTSVKSLLKTHTIKYMKYTARPFVKGLYEFGTDYEDCFTFSDVFKYNLRKDHFVLSIDVSEGLGGDASVIKIFKVSIDSNKKVRLISVAKFESFHISIDEFAKVVCKVFKVLDQDKCRLIIERNTYGDQLIIQMETYSMLSEEDYDIELETYAKFRRSADNPKVEKGLRLNSSNKRIGVSGFKVYMDERTIIETDEDTINQIREFGEDDRGRFRAGVGHDDQVMPIVNLSYYIKSQNYGWVDMIDEMIEEEQFDLQNVEILKNVGLWFDEQLTKIGIEEEDEKMSFDYDSIDDVLAKSGLSTYNPTSGKKAVDEFNEYDLEADDLEFAEENEYDFEGGSSNIEDMF